MSWLFLLQIFRLLKAYKKIHKFSGVISYFSTQQWEFDNKNVLELWERTPPADRKKFDFNLKSLDWHDFFYYHVRGLRLYILKDPLNTIDVGRVKFRRWVNQHNYKSIRHNWFSDLWKKNFFQIENRSLHNRDYRLPPSSLGSFYFRTICILFRFVVFQLEIRATSELPQWES